jgi:hypothetical protein
MRAMQYRIVVKGRLSRRFGSTFDGMTLEPRSGHTVLEGELTDQAQLYGVLNRLAGLGIELVSVNPTAPAHADHH